jgi:hypothetical protein
MSAVACIPECQDVTPENAEHALTTARERISDTKYACCVHGNMNLAPNWRAKMPARSLVSRLAGRVEGPNSATL